MRPIIDKHCMGVRGIRFFECRVCGKGGNNYANGVDVCRDCCIRNNICSICGQEIKGDN